MTKEQLFAIEITVMTREVLRTHDKASEVLPETSGGWAQCARTAGARGWRQHSREAAPEETMAGPPEPLRFQKFGRPLGHLRS